MSIKYSREWAMPSPFTFEIPPIRCFVEKYLRMSESSVDPFAGDSSMAKWTNDINPKTSANDHLDAETFLRKLHSQGVRSDLVIFDPPYSPRQISECYKDAGLLCGQEQTQNAGLYSRVRNAIHDIMRPSGIVLSFGWNTSGMGTTRGYEIIEILLCCHGGAHNDTICVAEILNQPSLGLM